MPPDDDVQVPLVLRDTPTHVESPGQSALVRQACAGAPIVVKTTASARLESAMRTFGCAPPEDTRLPLAPALLTAEQ
jgi:hypothetical protein